LFIPGIINVQAQYKAPETLRKELDVNCLIGLVDSKVQGSMVKDKLHQALGIRIKRSI
jgi:hypothetical protein